MRATAVIDRIVRMSGIFEHSDCTISDPQWEHCRSMQLNANSQHVKGPTFEGIMFSLRATMTTESLARSILEIGNTPSRVRDGSGARQRCATTGSAVASEAVYSDGYPSTMHASHAAFLHGYDQRLRWARPGRIGLVQIMHAGGWNLRPMGR